MLRSCAWLTLTVLVALLIVGGVAGTMRGSDAALAAAVAAGVCWFGSIAALVVTGYSGRSDHAVQGHLLGMFFRLGLPLACGLAFQKVGGTLADAGVFGLIVVFYLVTLVAETILSLRLIKQHRKTTPAT
jgi:hypothetical protein